jgi:hypothetical protein
LLPRRPGWTDNILSFFWVAWKGLSKVLKVYWASCGICWINPNFGRRSLSFLFGLRTYQHTFVNHRNYKQIHKHK